MSWPHLFNRLSSRIVRRTGRARAPRPRLRYSRPQLEQLEDRTLLSVTLTNSFAGISSSQNNQPIEPPDIQGAAGPSSVVSTVNLAISIFTKAGTQIATSSNANFFFSKGGGDLQPAAEEHREIDPFTLFDPLVQRFIVGEVDSQTPEKLGGTNLLLLAVSKNANPNSLTSNDWFFYSIDTTDPAVSLQDYPGVPGFNADALVVTLFGFDAKGDFVKTQVNAISMNALINGTPLTTTGANQNIFQTVPVEKDNPNINKLFLRPTSMNDSMPGRNDPMWLIAESAPSGGEETNGTNTSPNTSLDPSTLDVIRMDKVLSNNPTFDTFVMPVNPYTQAIPPLQPLFPAIADADSRILNASERNGVLVTTQEVSNDPQNRNNANGNNARWYAINVSSGEPVLQQQGEVSGGPDVYISYPAIDINAQGDIGMTYMQTSTTLPGGLLSMYITGRTAADAPGTMQTPVLVQPGLALYLGERLGDMSGINVDANGSFWAFSEFANLDTRPVPNWGTAIANFTLSPAPSPPPPSPEQTSTGLQQIVIVPDGGFAAEFMTAVVTSPDATVNGGTMTFDIAGTVLNVPVQSGRATALMILPLPFVAMPQQIGLTFTPANPDFASSSSEQSARLTPFNALNAGWVLLHTDGSQSVFTVIDGMLVGLIFNAQGQVIGFSLDLLTFNANRQFTGLDFDILPDLGALLPFTIGIVL